MHEYQEFSSARCCCELTRLNEFARMREKKQAKLTTVNNTFKITITAWHSPRLESIFTGLWRELIQNLLIYDRYCSRYRLFSKPLCRESFLRLNTKSSRIHLRRAGATKWLCKSKAIKTLPEPAATARKSRMVQPWPSLTRLFERSIHRVWGAGNVSYPKIRCCSTTLHIKALWLPHNQPDKSNEFRYGWWTSLSPIWINFRMTSGTDSFKPSIKA